VTVHEKFWYSQLERQNYTRMSLDMRSANDREGGATASLPYPHYDTFRPSFHLTMHRTIGLTD